MTRELDCRGQACPAPVLQVKEILEKEAPAALAVLVDNEAARENVCRFLTHNHYLVAVERAGNDIRVLGTAGTSACETMAPSEFPAVTAARKIMVMVTTDRMGHGDDGLGAALLLSFLKTLKEMGPELWRLVFVNNGVKLTAEGSEAVAIIQELAAEGAQILVCGTCLNHFGLLEKKQVGETTNMLDIVTSMQLADSVINI
jgi:selenium metabolism protein YedF